MKSNNSLPEGKKQWVRERLDIHFQKLVFWACVIFATFLSSLLHAQPVFPSGFSAMRMATGTFAAPVAAALAPDGRFFVVEQAGNVRIIKNNALLATPFVSLTVDSQGERGMVGIAVDPDFLNNKYIYVYYTVPASGGNPARNRISRFTATNDTATPGSGTVILDLDPLGAALIHNGGALHFGKDGKLYVAVGENSVGANAQNLDTYHGKVLRINKDGSAPPDNPFPTGSAQRRRVWAYGLRNPFTFSVDRETGKIFVNDVGGSSWEEINDATLPGRNFGWPSTEGKFNQASFPAFTNPVHAYAHGTGDGVGCAVVGGAFISPSNPLYPAVYRGKYLFQESCNNWLNILDLSGPTAVRSPFATQIHNNSLGLMTEIDGYMYYLHRGGGALYKMVYNGAIQPTITNQPANVSVVVGQPATFSVTAVGTPPLAYQWQKNSVNIPGATSATFTISQCTLANSGNYRVIVTNASGSATSNVAALTVVDNALPTAEILTPMMNQTYIAGQTISFSGRGTDPEDGNLPPASMTWHIDFQHDTHHHDEPPRVGISSGTFTIPQVGETSANVWYRIHLEVTDSEGFTSEDSVEIFPLKSTLSFNTNPAGLQILLDGQPFNTPGSVLSVEGIIRTIGTPSVQNLGNEAYVFESWTHGGAQNQSITTPSADITYTANFKRLEASFYRAINLDGPALSIDGHNFEGMTGAANFSYTTDRGLFANQAITLIPATDANRASMIRSSIWGYNMTLTVGAVPVGTYQVYVYVWEDSNPQIFSVSMEGTVVKASHNSGGPGVWSKLGPFQATINDGAINLAFTGPGYAQPSGIEIWSVGGNQPPVVSNAIANQTATAGTAFNFSFPANTFSDPNPGTTLTYTATLSGGGALPGWLSFSAGTRTFSGTPGSGDVGTLNIRVTASDGAGGSVNDEFALAVNAAGSAVFYRALNLDGPALTIDGHNFEAMAGAANFSYTTNRGLFADQSITLIPATDANRATMIRSSIWGYSVTLTVGAVPAGTYQVYVYVWEDSNPQTFSVSMEGTVVKANHSSGGRGIWSKLGPFQATINDGAINLAFTGPGYAQPSGLEIWSVGGGGGSSARASVATMDEEAANDNATLEAYPNPFGKKLTVRYTARQSGNARLELFDVRGRSIHLIHDGNMSAGETKEKELDTSTIPDGVYFLQFANGNHIFRLKLMGMR